MDLSLIYLAVLNSKETYGLYVPIGYVLRFSSVYTKTLFFHKKHHEMQLSLLCGSSFGSRQTVVVISGVRSELNFSSQGHNLRCYKIFIHALCHVISNDV